MNQLYRFLDFLNSDAYKKKSYSHYKSIFCVFLKGRRVDKIRSKKTKMATEERNIENIDLAEENKEINGTGVVNQISEERKEEIIVEITKVSIFLSDLTNEEKIINLYYLCSSSQKKKKI